METTTLLKRTLPADVPSVADVERIAAVSNPVLRNLLITQTYCELSTVFTQRTGRCANWCTFATWASKQAGQTIRSEDLRRSLQALLKNDAVLLEALDLLVLVARQFGAAAVEGRERSFLHGILENASQRASDAVARGNRKVYEEIAREFARFLLTCGGDTAFSDVHLAEMTTGLRPGPPPHGQDYLRQAFTLYYRAFFETDESRKTECCFHANLLIGFHEQTRLQPEIAEALNAAFATGDETKAALRQQLFSGSGIWARIKGWLQRLFGKASPLDKAIDAFAERLQEAVRRVLTHHLMTLTLPPATRLSLGRDLPATYPEVLKQLHEPDLLALLRQIDPTPDSLEQSGATDWANLPERLHFIAELFRCYHLAGDLLCDAFTKEQVAEMKAGRLPVGEL